MTALGEFERIEQILRPLASGDPGSLNLADDAALIDAEPGQQIVVTTDTMVDTVHFLAGTPPDSLAAKLLRVNLSDLAAMGARPFAYLLTTALPRNLGDDWLAAFARGLADDQERHSVHLIGGDSVSTSGQLSVGITAFGRVPSGQALRRDGARSGHGIYVTGTPGDAALGLQLLRQKRTHGLSVDDAEYLTGRYQRPTPRLEVGQRLVGIASAAIDISDGLAGDLGHICSASGVAATVVASRMPRSKPADKLLELNPELTHAALAGGDDYELLVTVASQNEAGLAAIRAECGVPITRIGAIIAGDAPRILDDAGREIQDLAGWRHF